jgi:23S rRNA pseudouridine1911/1915/1917 synthase
MTDSPQYLQVSPQQAGSRLDRYVAEHIETISRSQVQQLVQNRHILVNQQSAKPAQILRQGDVVTVSLPPPQPTELTPEPIPLDIVYEDRDVVVINKPAHMVVHPSAGHSSGTLVHALLARYPDMHISGDIRPGIVHRLDQDTTGLLVVARHDEAMRLLTAQQQARTMHKAYLTVVEGRMKTTSGVIDAPIGRHPTDRKRQAVVASGREARTHYTVLEPLGDYTLLEVVLETGRTHQIRVHLSHIQRPVLGDSLYGPRKPRARFGLQRQFLHAYKLGFVLPSSNQWHELTVPLPKDLEEALRKLRAKAHAR